MGFNGEIIKAFSIKDGYIFNYILKSYDIVPVILTARKNAVVQNCCDELGIKESYQGKLNKLATLIEIVDESNFNSCAYFGDDIIDLKVNRNATVLLYISLYLLHFYGVIATLHLRAIYTVAEFECVFLTTCSRKRKRECS